MIIDIPVDVDNIMDEALSSYPNYYFEKLVKDLSTTIWKTRSESTSSKCSKGTNRCRTSSTQVNCKTMNKRQRKKRYKTQLIRQTVSFLHRYMQGVFEVKVIFHPVKRHKPTEPRDHEEETTQETNATAHSEALS